MKKLWILPLAAIMMVACGEKEEEKGGDLSICDCVKMQGEMMDKMKSLDRGDEEAMKALEAEYKEKEQACRKLSEGKSQEEMMALQKEAEACM